jgi:hypothetical protein
METQNNLSTDYTVQKSVLIKSFNVCGIYTQLYFSPYCSFFFIIQPHTNAYKKYHVHKKISYATAGHIIARKSTKQISSPGATDQVHQ